MTFSLIQVNAFAAKKKKKKTLHTSRSTGLMHPSKIVKENADSGPWSKLN